MVKNSVIFSLVAGAFLLFAQVMNADTNDLNLDDSAASSFDGFGYGGFNYPDSCGVYTYTFCTYYPDVPECQDTFTYPPFSGSYGGGGFWGRGGGRWGAHWGPHTRNAGRRW